MARRLLLPVPREEEPGLSVTALIDISFLLLIYFLVTSTLNREESDLGMTLPGEFSTVVKFDDFQPFEITLDGSGQVWVDNDLLDANSGARSLPSLVERLGFYKRAANLVGEETLVIVNASDDARGQRLVDVLNAIAAVGADRVTMRGFAK